ncbi:MAG TPA: homoserine kinase [Caulobacteraceae bacterium]|nr:homoserine kinase [Caulobacteraceae bacterium]
MAVYTDISDAELDVFMAQFDLGAPVAFKGIAEGVSNSNFLLDTERGRFILTVYEARTDEADLPFFLSLMRWLHDAGYPSATPMPARDGALYKRMRGKPAAIVTFLNGMSVRRPGAAHCREAGVGLARLHLAAQGSGLSRANTLGQPYWAGMFAGYEDQAEALKPGLSAVIAADIAAFERLWPRDLPQGVIHADFFPDNVFFQGGKFAAAIDFYFACTDLYAYDVAVCLNAWCFEPDGSLNVTAARAFTGGYESVRPLSGQERAAVPLLAWGAAMRFFLTRLHDFRLGGSGALVKPHDPLEYERKLAVHRAAYASGEGLVVFGAGA